MHICFISVGRFLHVGAYLTYFKEAGHDVSLIALSPSLEWEVPTYNVGLGGKYSATKGKWKYPFSMLCARRVIKKLRPDLVHAHFATSGGLTSLVCGFHPTIVTVHGSDLVLGMQSRILRPLLKAIFNFADLVNTVSEDLANIVLQLGVSRDKIEILTLGIDAEKFYFVEHPPVSKKRALRLVCTRQMDRHYDHATIIKALGVLKKRGVDFHMTFAGSGPLKEEIVGQVTKAALSERVMLLGPVHNDNLPKILHENDVYLSASVRDGTSLSLLEAMATGVFPIVSDIRANSDWLEHGVDGLLFKVSDPNALVDCVLRFCSNPHLAVIAAQRNRIRVVEQGDRNKNMKRLERIYEELIARGG